MTRTHKISIPRTAHYYTIGSTDTNLTDIWIACHGYGQLAQHFVKRFDVLDDGKTFVLAPEGLSRFYVEGFSGPVGASWMTREDRLDEIADYISYLKMLYALYVAPVLPSARVTLFGFSQGCATICRWMLAERPHFDRLILYAGMLPEDLDFRQASAYFQEKELICVYGNADPFITDDRIRWQKSFAAEQGLPFQFIPFEGSHEVSRAVLEMLR